MPNANIQSLNQELQDRIIDGLVYDKASLKSCALTRRCWLNQCRKHIHHNIRATPRTPPDEQRYSSPEVAKYVQALTFDGRPYNQKAEDDTFVHTISQNRISVIDRVESLTYLRLQNCSFSSITPKERSAIIAAFPVLKTLAIGSCDFRTLNEFSSFMAAFPTIQYLEVSGIEIMEPSQTTSVATSSPRLSKLSLVNLSPVKQSTMCQWLAVVTPNFVDEFHLEVIFCEDNSEDALEGLSDVLQTLGGTVKHLDIGYESECDDTSRADLSCSTALQSLRLRHSFNSYDEPYGQVNWVAATLSTVSSPLQKLNIEVIKTGDNEAFDDGHVDIGPLDDALSGPAYKDLKQFVFWFPDSMEPDAKAGTEEFLRKGLANSAAGIPMQIVYRDYFEAKSHFRYRV